MSKTRMTNNPRLICLCLLVFLFSSSQPVFAETNPTTAALGVEVTQKQQVGLSGIFDEIIATNERPFYGLVALMQGGKISYLNTNAYQGALVPTLDSRFMLASQSKMITAALVMQAVADAKFSLDDKITPYLRQAGLAGYDERITLDQLLSHSSGIAPSGKPNRFTPGSDFQYSNLGYQVLAQVLEAVYQQPFTSLVTHFLKRHGINGITAQLGEQTGLLKGIEISSGEPMNYEVQMNLLPGGGMTGSALGLLTYLRALHSGNLLPAVQYQMMTTPRILRPHRWPQLYYGYGVQVNRQELNEYSHSGYLSGYQSLSLSYPEFDTYLVVLENASWPLDDKDKVFGLHDKLRHALRNALILERP
ncbi:serine hydrolase domain-containing protein [Shewanella sp. Isolate11]|uniref:serine hydrolase domain-containing protein n=1 Tax=Shewanella sp. Isolate11 TaxID=2908530 RepID=UPI001EFED91C|nr:serine hydrolase domain-containing protein [Shewanella sp. Isolate11]MCG9697746.1 beta-lactamase family protein [Shewanella sp. Isolate11]